MKTFIIFSCSLFFTIHTSYANISGGVKRHITVYGDSNVLSKYTNKIAFDYSCVITEWWKYNEVNKLKEINPNINILYYRDAIGILKSYDDWSVVKQHKDWFVKDIVTGGLIKHRDHGWYLMDITSQDYRTHLINYINNKSKAYPQFNGVFLDDVRTYLNPTHFIIELDSGELSNSIPQFNSEFIRNYINGIISFLSELNEKLNNRDIFVNSDDPSLFLAYIDGLMFEGFVHGSWQDRDYLPTMTNWEKHIVRLKKLITTGKVVLVQSGSQGVNKECLQQFLFTFTSFLLCAEENSSFYFDLPTEEGMLSNFFEYDFPLGKPQEEIPILETINEIIFHDSFEELASWSPYDTNCIHLDRNDYKNGFASLCFNSKQNEGCYLYKYIELPYRSSLKISCWAKGMNIVSGDASWKFFSVLGKFCDTEKKIIKGGIDLLFPTSSFEWSYFEASYEIPSNAHYFFINSLGFSQTSQGTGWIDDLQVSVLKRETNLFKREFEKGIILVNPTQSSLEFDSSEGFYDISGNLITHLAISGHTGLMLYKSPVLSPPHNLLLKIAP